MGSIANLIEPRQSIYVDSLTAVPLKLYMEFENAGESAKRRGQHTLRESRATDGTIIRRLVMNQDSVESQRGQIKSKLDIMKAKLAALRPVHAVRPARWSVGAGRFFAFGSEPLR